MRVTPVKPTDQYLRLAKVGAGRLYQRRSPVNRRCLTSRPFGFRQFPNRAATLAAKSLRGFGGRPRWPRGLDV